MNIILMLVDSLNRHHLPAYGGGPVPTPNLDRLATRSYRFDNHFVGSLPCMPARREIFTGHKEMMWRPWGPLEPYDQRLPRLLQESGYRTAIVTDHYHYWEEEANGYLQSFQSAEKVRGHEIDYFKQPVPKHEPVPAWVGNIERSRPGDWARRYYANVKDFASEEDYFPAKVFSGAAHWLQEESSDGPFFLQVESFDVHEPFDVPEPYASMFGDGADRERFTVWPPYTDSGQLRQFMQDTSEEELAFIRSQYFGKLAMVDRWLGEFLDKLDELSLWDETAVILTTDHGHDLGERGVFGKQYPHYDSHANIPLFVWHPELPANGQSVSDLTQTVDLFATVLDLAGKRPPENAHSRSLLPLLAGDRETSRQALLYGTFGQGICVTDGEWTLFKSPVAEEPLNYYSSMVYRSLILDSLAEPSGHGRFIPGVQMPQWQVPVSVEPDRKAPGSSADYLFDRSTDPGQEDNLWSSKSEQREQLLALARGLLAEEGTPPEQYSRLGLTTSG